MAGWRDRELERGWCSHCVSQTEHTLVEKSWLPGWRSVYTCGACRQRTVACIYNCGAAAKASPLPRALDGGMWGEISCAQRECSWVPAFYPSAAPAHLRFCSCCADDYSCLVCRSTIVAWPGTRANQRGQGEGEAEGGVLQQVDRALNPTVRSYVKERTARTYLREHMRNTYIEREEGLLSIDEAISAATSGAEVLVECDLAKDAADKELLAAVAHSVSRSLECLEVHIGRTSEEDALNRLLQSHSEVSEKLAAYKRLTEDRHAAAASQGSAAAGNLPAAPHASQELAEGRVTGAGSQQPSSVSHRTPDDAGERDTEQGVHGAPEEAGDSEQGVQGAGSTLLTLLPEELPVSACSEGPREDNS